MLPSLRDLLRGALRSLRYATLAGRIADAPEVLALAGFSRNRQPPVNMLLASVHFLLLGGADHPLASFYPSVGGREPAAGAWEAFTDFCRRYREEIVALVAGRRVQTNEVGRCGLIMPAFAMAHEALRRPLHLVEVGASAGLNLLFDHYRYDYGEHGALGPMSPVVIRTELRGDRPIALPRALPPVADRIGIDIAPVDVRDDDAIRWVEALIWPDEPDRLALHRAARTVVRADPPRLVAGDGLDLVPGIVEEVRRDAVPCVYHSHATCQMTSDWRKAFETRIEELGRERDLAYVSLEWLGSDPGPRLHVILWTGGARRRTHLGLCDHHGRWVRREGRGTEGLRD